MANYIYYIEVIGIISFAISGALEGIKNKMDLLGVIILGIVTATGGGIIRDMMLGIFPPTSLRTGVPIYIAIVTAIIVFYISLKNSKINKTTVNKVLEDFLVIADALGLAVFTITGMQIAYYFGESHSGFLYVFLGVTTGVGGGIIRDLLTNNIPYIMERHVYASAAIVGALVFHFMHRANIINEEILIIITIAIIFSIRFIAYKKKWNLPKATEIRD